MKVEIRAVYLKGTREKRGLTQRQLAKDIGISQNYIPALEAGARHPTAVKSQAATVSDVGQAMSSR